MSIIFLKTAMLSTVILTALGPFHGSIVARLAGYAAILSIIFCGAAGICFKRANVHVLFLIVLFWELICGLIYGDIPDKVGYLQNGILLLTLMLCMLKKDVQLREKDTTFLFLCNFCTALIYIAYGYLPTPFRYTVANEYGYMAFTMGFGNPNATSISVMAVIMLLIIETQYKGTKQPKKWRNFVAVGLLFRVLWLLESRTCLICTIGFIIMIVLYSKRNIPCRRLFIGAVLISVISILGHIWLSTIGNIVVLGKPLASGRSVMLAEALHQIKAAPLLYVLGCPGVHMFENYHNAPLSLFCNIGLVGCIEYYCIFGKTMGKIRARSQKNPVARGVYIALLGFIFESCSEAGVLFGAVPFIVNIAVLLYLGTGIEYDQEETGRRITAGGERSLTE